MHNGYKSQVPTGEDAIAYHFKNGNFKAGITALQALMLGRLSGKINHSIAAFQLQLDDLKEQAGLIGKEAYEAKGLA